MSVAAPSTDARSRNLPLERISTATLLGSLIALCVALRLVGAWARATPTFFPDEYLYAELGRSIATDGSLLVRGAATSFPSILQPIVTAPAWLAEDVATSFWLVQGIGTIVMSLAAVPVFALARYLGVGRGLSLALAALALAVPDVLLSGWLVSEPIAYPLALAAVWAGVRAIDVPSGRRQAVFLVLAGLTTLARFQLAVLLVAFLLAVVASGARERRLRETLAQLRVTLAILVGGLAAGLALAVSGGLGPYSGALELDLDLAAFAKWMATNGLVLAYASGWVLIPGALIAIVLAFARPVSRAEFAFASFAAAFAIGLLAEAAFVSAAITGQAHERYVFSIIPLAGIAFVLWTRRGWPGRLWHAALALGLVVISAAVPLSGFAAGTGKTDSVFLRAFSKVEALAGSVSAGATVVAVVVLVISLLTIAVAARPSLGRPLIVACAIAACAATSVLATVFDAENSRNARLASLPVDPSWVDNAELGPVTMLWNFGGRPADAHEHLFWNRSIDRVVLLPDALPFDGWHAELAAISGDGALIVAGETVAGPMLVDDYATTVVLVGARPVGQSPHMTLWVPDGEPRVSLIYGGRFDDGWLAPVGVLTVWPEPDSTTVAGWFELPLANVQDREAQVAISVPGVRPGTIALAAGGEGLLRVAACSEGAWNARVEATPSIVDAGRFVTVPSGIPRYVPDPAACRPPE